MRIFKSFRERIILLEYEMKMLAEILDTAPENGVIPTPPPYPPGRRVYKDGWDISYETLRKKYRK